MARRILVLFAHPAQSKSEVNVKLAAAARRAPGVTLVDLYDEYPTFEIDVDREQRRLVEHDVVVFLHPLYWYSTPAILKEWQDLVLEHGFAYGQGGDALTDKILLSATSAGGARKAYCREGSNHFTVRELLRPLEQTAGLCHMIYLPPFVLYGARCAVEEGRLAGHVALFERLLAALRDDAIDVDAADALQILNPLVEALGEATS